MVKNKGVVHLRKQNVKIIGLFKAGRFIFPLMLLIILAILQPSFLTMSNFVNILRQSSILFILAAGQTLVILTEGIDLSIGSIIGFTACMAGSLVINDGNNVIGIFLAIILGMLIGLINGYIISHIRVPAFVTTYGMQILIRGLTIAFMKGDVYWGFNDSFRFIGAGSIGAIPMPIIIGVLVLIIFYFLLNYSTFGQSIYYLGNNRNATKVSGFKIRKIETIVYAISGLVASIGGLLYLSRLNSAEASLGTGFEMDAIAAVVLGGTSFFGAEGKIENAIIGSITITLLKNAMNLLGISSYWQPFIIGLLIVVIIANERAFEKLRNLILVRERVN